MPVKAIPDGYRTVTPYLMVSGAAQLIDFVKHAFEAEEIDRLSMPDGTVAHAEVRIGDSLVMVTEATGQWNPMPASFYLYVPDADTTYRRALQAGATSVMEPADQFYGDRSAGVRDPSGNLWWVATRIEDISREELHRRGDARAQQASATPA
jgi:PhnB protein